MVSGGPDGLRTDHRNAGEEAQSPMKIIATVNLAWNVWNFRRPVIAALLEKGHAVTVLAPADGTTPSLREMGCDFRDLEMDSKGLSLTRDFGTLLRMRRAFASVRPDVILSYTIKNNIYGAFAARSLRIPFIPNVSGLGTAFLSGGALQMVARWLYRRAFAKLPVVFFQNRDDRDLFVQMRLVTAQQARVLPGSGIDLARFAPAPYPPGDEAPTFLLIARLLRDKGVVEYVEAARQVRAEHPGARFQLLGQVDANNRTAIDQQTLDEWVAAGDIEYLGTSDDVRDAIAKAHCIVLPSYREGAPRTLIEGAAMARPAIASDVPGCNAVVRDGETGLLCEVRSARSLAQSCRQFIALPRERKLAMSRAGRELMEREYDERLVVEAYEKAIGDVVRDRDMQQTGVNR